MPEINWSEKLIVIAEKWGYLELLTWSYGRWKITEDRDELGSIEFIADTPEEVINKAYSEVIRNA